MNSQNATSSILILGVVILGIFSYVVAFNMLPNNIFSDSYYSKIDDEMSAKIEKYELLDNKIVVYTTGNNASICIKTTKSSPQKNALCWKKIKENKIEIPVLQNEVYYIWIKDENGVISTSKTYKSSL